MKKNAAFYIDPSREITRTYNDLISDISQRTQWRKLCRSSDAYEIFVSLLHSILHERDITLCDAEWSIEERRAIGITEGEEAILCNVHTLTDLTYERIRNELQRSAANIVFMTSGSTGTPKRIRQSIQVLLSGVRTGKGYSKDRWALAYHPAHIAGIHVFLQAFLNKNMIIRTYDSNAEEFHRILDEFGVTCLSATPTYLRTRIMAGKTSSKMIRVTTGGEKHDPTLTKRMTAAFPNAKYRNVYSTTETGSLFASDTDIFTVSAEILSKIRIDDGLLYVKTDRTNDDDSGWIATGDRVEVIDNDPLRFRFLGRDDDMVNVGGYKVDPFEVEEALRAIDDVRDAVVYSVRNSVLGDLLAADVVPFNSDLTEQVVHEALTGRLAEYKIPRMITFVKELPITRTGKRLRK